LGKSGELLVPYQSNYVQESFFSIRVLKLAQVYLKIPGYLSTDD
jgi:hypothetical protein